MFKLPTDNWGEKERLNWQIAVARNLRWSSFTMLGFLTNVAGCFDIIVTAAFDDPRLDGLRVGMPVTVSPSPTLNGAIGVVGAWVAVDNEITVRFINSTGAVVNQPSETWAYFGVLL